MNLSPKSLQALTLLKAELLSRQAVPKAEQAAEAIEIPPQPLKREKEKKPFTIMRHARMRGESWQRYKRTGGW